MRSIGRGDGGQRGLETDAGACATASADGWKLTAVAMFHLRDTLSFGHDRPLLHSGRCCQRMDPIKEGGRTSIGVTWRIISYRA